MEQVLSAPARAAALAGIAAATAFARFYRLDVTWFMLDQVRDVTASSAIAGGTSFPALGPRIGWTAGERGGWPARGVAARNQGFVLY